MIRSFLNLRHLMATQLYLALGSAVALTLAAALVGWFSFNNLGEAQSRVNEDTVPELTAAFKVAQEHGCPHRRRAPARERQLLPGPCGHIHQRKRIP